MTTERNSYSNIFKAIGLFGGVKVFQILIGIIKNKIVAVLLGPFGMGINGLITSNTHLIKSFTEFGLQTSSVRDIAKATESRDEDRIGLVAAVLRRLIWITGLLGTAITFLLAEKLSIWSFGNTDYTLAFRIVSISLLFDQFYTGQTALMQGTFHYRYIASSSLWGSIIGLIVSVPLYYIWGVKAIVPVIVLSAVTAFLLTWYYSNKINIKKIKVTWKEVWTIGNVMIVLGLAVALSGILRTGKTYITRVFISSTGSLDDVGLYTAAITIATQYINVILSAMASDYSPRLAAISDNRELFVDVMNKQSKLMLTIMLPVILLFIVFIKEFTFLLYSEKFIPITGMIEWMMLGMFFRVISFCLSFAFVAKGESKLFFWNEFASTVYSLLLFLVGYKVARFDGVGIAFFISYAIYSIQVFVICRRKYGFRYTKDNFKSLVLQMVFVFLVFAVLKVFKYSLMRYVLGSIALILSLLYTYKKLDEMIPLKKSFQNIKVKFLKKKRNGNR